MIQCFSSPASAALRPAFRGKHCCYAIRPTDQRTTNRVGEACWEGSVSGREARGGSQKGIRRGESVQSELDEIDRPPKKAPIVQSAKFQPSIRCKSVWPRRQRYETSS